MLAQLVASWQAAGEDQEVSQDVLSRPEAVLSRSEAVLTRCEDKQFKNTTQFENAELFCSLCQSGPLILDVLDDLIYSTNTRMIYAAYTHTHTHTHVYNCLKFRLNIH